MKVRRVDWYPADWLEGTAELSYFDEVVYADICNLIYARGGPIAVLLLQSRGKCHGNQLNAALVRLEQAGKIVRNGPEIDQKRCRNELERRQKIIRKAQENGAKGGKINGLEKAEGCLLEKAINHQPSTINHQKETRASRALSNEEFDSWWEYYPDKVGKGAARKAFSKALTKTSLNQLVTGVERYKATKPIDRAWCHPATWLNQERWSDDPGPVSNGHDISEHRKPRMPAPQV
jgi:hypothetical protein